MEKKAETQNIEDIPAEILKHLLFCKNRYRERKKKYKNGITTINLSYLTILSYIY